MTIKVKRIICFSGMGLILAIVIALNIAAGIFSNEITTYLYGFGVDFSGTEQAMADGDELCREIAGEGTVLLKNENNALPLLNTVKLNVFGWGATDGGFVISGSGSGSADERGTGIKKLFLEGLADAGFAYNQELITMYESFRSSRQGSSLTSSSGLFFRLYEPGSSYYTTSIMNTALSYSDTALIVISRLGGEGQDIPKLQTKQAQSGNSAVTDDTRHYLELSSEEEALIETVSAAGFNNVIVVMNTCNAFELGFLEKAGIDAAVSIGGGGQSGAASVAKLLKGDGITPSGKTVDTYAYDMTSDPAYINSGAAGVVAYTGSGNYIDYSEGIYVGYRYYETAYAENAAGRYPGFNYDDTVQYPFGFGLSYTEFEWDVQDISPAKGAVLTKGGQISIDVLVTNTGEKHSGQDIVQVYFNAPYTYGGIEKPYVQLAAFAKTSILEPGESELLTLKFSVKDMASYDCYDANGSGFTGYELDAGSYSVRLQNDAHNVNGCENSIINYTAPNIRYDTDEIVDGVAHKFAKNLFTGDAAYAGIAIDGRDSDANIIYMTRGNFAGTFPAAQEGRRAKSSSIGNLSDKYGYDAVITTDTPTQGVSGGMSLIADEDGKTVMNDDLVMAIGADYDDPLWEALLNQLTVSELNSFIEDGGYKTAAASSVGKVACIDLDGPSGLNQTNMSGAESSWTCYPVETVMASTWNAHLSYAYGLSVGAEAAATNVSGWYAPAVNIHRSPFGGRNFEYYSEDSYLSGIMGAETTRGALANGLYCYVKHFAVNETETGRSGLYTWLTEQTLRELYLKPFEIAVKKGGANAIMSSFNRLGAVWTGGCYPLLTTILRDEWGFRGSVVTDYSTGGTYMNVDQGIRAGNDLWLSGIGTAKGHDDTTSATAIYCARQAARNILYTYTNTYYTSMTHDPSEDRYIATKGFKDSAGKFPYWVFGLAAVDAAAVAGVGLWAFFLLRKPKNKKEALA